MGVKAYTLKMNYVWFPVLFVSTTGIYFLLALWCTIVLGISNKLVIYFFCWSATYGLCRLINRLLPRAMAIVYYDNTVVRKELNKDILFKEIVGKSIPYTNCSDCQGISKYVLYLTEEELNQILF